MDGMMGLLQLAGGMVLAVGYVPQIQRILRSRSAHDLSLGMWSSVVLGLLMMEVYAVKLAFVSGEPFVLVTNSISLLFSATLVMLILLFGDRPASVTVVLSAATRIRRRRPPLVQATGAEMHEVTLTPPLR